MIKTYCDSCEEEITDSNRVDGQSSQIREDVLRKDGTPFFTVVVGLSADCNWGDADFCKYCVIDAINRADDRPKYG